MLLPPLLPPLLRAHVNVGWLAVVAGQALCGAMGALAVAPETLTVPEVLVGNGEAVALAAPGCDAVLVVCVALVVLFVVRGREVCEDAPGATAQPPATPANSSRDAVKANGRRALLPTGCFRGHCSVVLHMLALPRLVLAVALPVRPRRPARALKSLTPPLAKEFHSRPAAARQQPKLSPSARLCRRRWLRAVV